MLESSEMSLFFVDALADPAREFLVTHFSSRITLEQIVVTMTRHHNSETRNLQLQSEMDSMDLSAFMTKHQVTDYSAGITKIVK